MQLIKVPGVNKILGTFVSCSKGPAVCLVDDRMLEASFSVRNDGIVKACIGKTGECKKFPIGTGKIKKDDRWFNAVKCVYLVMEKNYKDLPCFDISLDGNLLDCEGRIILSAIAVATIKAINAQMKLNLKLDEIAKIASNAIVMFSGSCNMSDIITMLYGKTGEFIIYNGVTKEFEAIENPFKGSEYSLLMLDGHVPVSAVKEEALSKENEICSVIKKYEETYDVTCMDFSNPEFKDKILALDEDSKRLCKYLYEQHKSSSRISDFLKGKDLACIGKTFDKIRFAAEEYLEITCPEMEWVMKRASEIPGYAGSCLFYEGYNTKVAAIMKNESIDKLMAQAEEYQHIFGFGITAQIVGDYKI